MKVKIERQFTPIVITLETEAEAIVLWHRLNVSDGTFSKYYEENNIKENDRHGDVSWDMWRKLNSVVSSEGIR